jgi:uncharacterized RDD family membrane protein YckC
MKCPKCGYLGFETVDRCRNCGYDFSFASAPAPAEELPLNDGRGPGSAFDDFEIGRPAATRTPPELDLDRLIGVDSEGAAPESRSEGERATTAVPGPTGLGDPLPLFSDEDVPLGARTVAAPRPVGPPLAVRRATPEIPRGRPRGARPPRRTERPLAFEPEADAPRPAASPGSVRSVPAGLQQASPGLRLLAALIDIALVGGINAAVLYFTVQMAGLTLSEIGLLPRVPMASFLLLLDGGYLAALTAAGGKTIGKMAMGIRVIGDDGRAVDASGAVLHAVGALLTVATLGLPFLPALLPGDRRTLAERLAGTRVVRAD